jgi:hypothetical protein
MNRISRLGLRFYKTKKKQYKIVSLSLSLSLFFYGKERKKERTKVVNKQIQYILLWCVYEEDARTVPYRIVSYRTVSSFLFLIPTYCFVNDSLVCIRYRYFGIILLFITEHELHDRIELRCSSCDAMRCDAMQSNNKLTQLSGSFCFCFFC